MTPDEVKDWIKSNASGTLKAYKDRSCRIYRGTNAPYETYLINPKESPNRMSANTSNIYTLFINHDPSWKEYPKREIICTTDKFETYHSRSFIVIPKNGAKIGVCPSNDIWNSETKYSTSLDQFNDTIMNLFYITDKRNQLATFARLKKAFKSIDDNKHKLEGSDLIKDYIKSGKSFYEFYASIMNPEKMGFKVVKVGYEFSDSDRREVWLDTECLLINIRSTLFEELFKNEKLGLTSNTKSYKVKMPK